MKQQLTELCVVDTYSSSVSDMVTADVTPEGEEKEADKLNSRETV